MNKTLVVNAQKLTPKNFLNHRKIRELRINLVRQQEQKKKQKPVVLSNSNEYLQNLLNVFSRKTTFLVSQCKTDTLKLPTCKCINKKSCIFILMQFIICVRVYVKYDLKFENAIYPRNKHPDTRIHMYIPFKHTPAHQSIDTLNFYVYVFVQKQLQNEALVRVLIN